MDEDFFTLDTTGNKSKNKLKDDYDSSSSLSLESLPSEPDCDNVPSRIDVVELNEDIITLEHNFPNEDDNFINKLREHIYSIFANEPFCKKIYSSGNNYSLKICKNELTNKLNQMSFLLRHNCYRSYPRFLRYTKVPLSKHVKQNVKRYYANIPNLTSSNNCPEPSMDFTHCLSALYLLPKDMCTGCGRRDCSKTWNNNKPCDYYPCNVCGQIKQHRCRKVSNLTSMRNQNPLELPSHIRDYLASSLKCLVCGRIGHGNCAQNAQIGSFNKHKQVKNIQKSVNNRKNQYNEQNRYGGYKNYRNTNPYQKP